MSTENYIKASFSEVWFSAINLKNVYWSETVG